MSHPVDLARAARKRADAAARAANRKAVRERVDPALLFVARCPRCDAILDVIPTEDDWRTAEAWAYLATVAHRDECNKPPPKPPPDKG